MPKGLKRSLNRGNVLDKATTKQRIFVNETITVSATGSAIGFGTAVIGGLPESHLMMIGASANLRFAGSGSDANLSDTWSGDFAVGTTPASDATISGNDADIIASTAIGAATDEVVDASFVTRAGIISIDNKSGVRELNLNILIDAADIVDDADVDITVTGVFEIVYATLGDD